MGQVIQLRRPGSPVPVPAPVTTPPTFYFDLACPHAYLAAERIDRRFATADWRPAASRHLAASMCAAPGRAGARAIAAAERRARELHLPLIWPDRFPAPVPHAMRAATFASERGHGAAFAIAVGRLAFCGGFDVDEEAILAEAAAAAALDVDATLAAAADPRRDRLVEAAGRALWAAGGRALPAVRLGGRVFHGEGGITAALVAARDHGA
jgi:2-hydroxychromene-2-carboxylate isomerase